MEENKNLQIRMQSWEHYTMALQSYKAVYYFSSDLKVLYRGLSEIYLSCYNLFLLLLYYRRRNKRHKTVLSMLSCVALERSNSSFIESIVEPCVSKSRKEIFAVLVWLGIKFWKRVRWWKKVFMSNRKRNLCTCVWERKKITLKSL